jgi:hypothetical protein
MTCKRYLVHRYTIENDEWVRTEQDFDSYAEVLEFIEDFNTWDIYELNSDGYYELIENN